MKLERELPKVKELDRDAIFICLTSVGLAALLQGRNIVWEADEWRAQIVLEPHLLVEEYILQ